MCYSARPSARLRIRIAPVESSHDEQVGSRKTRASREGIRSHRAIASARSRARERHDDRGRRTDPWVLVGSPARSRALRSSDGVRAGRGGAVGKMGEWKNHLRAPAPVAGISHARPSRRTCARPRAFDGSRFAPSRGAPEGDRTRRRARRVRLRPRAGARSRCPRARRTSSRARRLAPHVNRCPHQGSSIVVTMGVSRETSPLDLLADRCDRGVHGRRRDVAAGFSAAPEGTSLGRRLTQNVSLQIVAAWSAWLPYAAGETFTRT